ncbi:non-canonical purine NTP pyrophosphatase [Mechercharimyces sp. CAU 1602]|uniref:non-canonical purine NTP pyrophosphatase n=1 Tax=Mechercharimyces sp. CAU 1602 TaxID=2973933 RepID=UPI0021612559|nr:non-canonical purine NTP pyrophosphatase [Mechercharimyces sp. CAU 1602]MCS1352208.1 hypothetical protein [Mechercharimyces sp. CAU 1602]
MQITFVTQNEEKLKEASHALRPYGIEVCSHPLPLVEPDLETVEEVAQEKLRQVQTAGLNRAIVDDAGIFFAAYNQFPGVLTKRVFQRIGYKGIVQLLHNQSREAYFLGSVAVVWDSETAIFTGRTNGEIVEIDPHLLPEVSDFPFDPIFIPTGEKQTLAQLSIESKLSHSYRRKALDQLATWLKEREI